MPLFSYFLLLFNQASGEEEKVNPIAEEDDYRLEVLINLGNLERLDKTNYIHEEREEAKDILEQRLEELAKVRSTFYQTECLCCRFHKNSTLHFTPRHAQRAWAIFPGVAVF